MASTLGPLQARAGDPTPPFELLLSPTAARRATPLLGLITAAGSYCSRVAARRIAARR